MSLGDKTLQAIKEVKQILKKHGKKGWLRVKECERHFVKFSPEENPETRRRRFYRLTQAVKKGKINELQHVELGKFSYIGLKEAAPTTLKDESPTAKSYLTKRMWEIYGKIVNLHINPTLRYRDNGTTYYYHNTREISKLILILAEMHPKIRKEIVKSVENSKIRPKPKSEREALLNLRYYLTTSEFNELIAKIGKTLAEIEGEQP